MAEPRRPVAGRIPAWVVVGAAVGVVLVAMLWEWLGVRQALWQAVVIVAAAVCGGWAIERLHNVAAPGELSVYAGLAVLAAAACVPETSHLARSGAVCLGAAVVAYALRTPAIDALAVGFAAWAALYGSVGRPSAVLGSIVAFAPLVAIAALGSRSFIHRVGVAGVCFLAAAAMARTGGIVAGASVARPAAWALLWCAVMAAVVAADAVLRRRRTPPSTGI